MTLFFPDLNVWLAFSVAGHSHSSNAWNWRKHLPPDTKLIFSRYTQIGLLRLLTNRSVMGDQTLTLQQAWSIYDRWLQDSCVEFYPEPQDANKIFRQITKPYSTKLASNAVGDCWLLAFAVGVQATLVTFDRALHEFARKQHRAVIIPT